MFRIDRHKVNMTKSLDLQAFLAPPPSGLDETRADESLSREPDTSFIDEALAELGRREEEISRLREEAENLGREADREAKAILSRASDEAGKKLEAAEELAVEIRSNAWKEGYEEGQRTAATEMADMILEAREQLGSIFEEIAKERDHMFDTLEQDAVTLVLEVAKKVIGDVVLKDKELFSSMMIRAAREMKSKRQLSICVSPEASERFFPGGKTEFQIGDRIVSASIVPDRELVGAELIIESENEIINAGVETQLRIIELKFSEPSE